MEKHITSKGSHGVLDIIWTFQINSILVLKSTTVTTTGIFFKHKKKFKDIPSKVFFRNTC